MGNFSGQESDIILSIFNNNYLAKNRYLLGHIDFPLGDGVVYGHDLTCEYNIGVEHGKVSLQYIKYIIFFTVL